MRCVTTSFYIKKKMYSTLFGCVEDNERLNDFFGFFFFENHELPRDFDHNVIRLLPLLKRIKSIFFLSGKRTFVEKSDKKMVFVNIKMQPQ